MKYFLETLWNFVQQIPRRVTGLIHPPHSSPSLSHQNTHLHPVRSRKRRKTFRSFLREESNSRRRSANPASRKAKSLKMPLFRKSQQKSKFLMRFESDSLKEEHSKDNFTNEVLIPPHRSSRNARRYSRTITGWRSP
jgi:tRNA(Leu) C34 or U34 (ribose-2'-O)-methylase TrmL